MIGLLDFIVALLMILNLTKKTFRIENDYESLKLNSSRLDKMIVISMGEGGICVISSNDNIESLDYIQSSDDLYMVSVKMMIYFLIIMIQ